MDKRYLWCSFTAIICCCYAYMEEDDDDNKNLVQESIDATGQRKIKNYGKKITSFFLAPQTGEYKFYSSCSRNCDVFLSDTNSITNRDLIISQKEGVQESIFERYPDQASHTIYMKKHHKYFLQASSPSNRDDSDLNLSVGVVLPDDTKLFPIAKRYLRNVVVEKIPIQDFLILENHKDSKNIKTKSDGSKRDGVVFKRSKNRSRKRVLRKLKRIGDFIKSLEESKSKKKLIKDPTVNEAMDILEGYSPKTSFKLTEKQLKTSNPFREASNRIIRNKFYKYRKKDKSNVINETSKNKLKKQMFLSADLINEDARDVNPITTDNKDDSAKDEWNELVGDLETTFKSENSGYDEMQTKHYQSKLEKIKQEISALKCEINSDTGVNKGEKGVNNGITGVKYSEENIDKNLVSVNKNFQDLSGRKYKQALKSFKPHLYIEMTGSGSGDDKGVAAKFPNGQSNGRVSIISKGESNTDIKEQTNKTMFKKIKHKNNDLADSETKKFIQPLLGNQRDEVNTDLMQPELLNSVFPDTLKDQSKAIFFMKLIQLQEARKKFEAMQPKNVNKEEKIESKDTETSGYAPNNFENTMKTEKNKPHAKMNINVDLTGLDSSNDKLSASTNRPYVTDQTSEQLQSEKAALHQDNLSQDGVVNIKISKPIGLAEAPAVVTEETNLEEKQYEPLNTLPQSETELIRLPHEQQVMYDYQNKSSFLDLQKQVENEVNSKLTQMYSVAPTGTKSIEDDVMVNANLKPSHDTANNLAPKLSDNESNEKVDTKNSVFTGSSFVGVESQHPSLTNNDQSLILNTTSIEVQSAPNSAVPESTRAELDTLSSSSNSADVKTLEETLYNAFKSKLTDHKVSDDKHAIPPQAYASDFPQNNANGPILNGATDSTIKHFLENPTNNALSDSLKLNSNYESDNVAKEPRVSSFIKVDSDNLEKVLERAFEGKFHYTNSEDEIDSLKLKDGEYLKKQLQKTIENAIQRSRFHSKPTPEIENTTQLTSGARKSIETYASSNKTVQNKLDIPPTKFDNAGKYNDLYPFGNESTSLTISIPDKNTLIQNYAKAIQSDVENESLTTLPVHNDISNAFLSIPQEKSMSNELSKVVQIKVNPMFTMSKSTLTDQHSPLISAANENIENARVFNNPEALNNMKFVSLNDYPKIPAVETVEEQASYSMKIKELLNQIDIIKQEIISMKRDKAEGSNVKKTLIAELKFKKHQLNQLRSRKNIVNKPAKKYTIPKKRNF